MFILKAVVTYSKKTMPEQRKHLGEILYKAGLVEKEALINAIKTSKTSNKRLGQVLVELGLIDEETLTKAIAKQFGLRYVNLDKTTIPSDAIKLVPEDLIKNHNVLPLGMNNGRLQLIIGDPTDLEMIDALRFRLNTELECYVANPSKIRACLEEKSEPVEVSRYSVSDSEERETFEYSALDSQGVGIKGEVEARSLKEAISKIRNMGYFPTKVQPVAHHTTDYIVTKCNKCGTKNRIRPHSDSVRPICGKCGSPISYDTRPSALSLIFLNSLILVALIGVICFIIFTPAVFSKDFLELKAIENTKMSELREREEKKLSELEAQLKLEVVQIDPTKLHEEASRHYRSILDARNSYDKRYALTPRERAQLRMRELASDSTKSYHDAIKAVALEASPKGSDINIVGSLEGTALHIDFDMSSMTSGEHGIMTKHTAKSTLKNEVISLISRVTNDLFQFCKDLELQTIHVGCRHYVRTTYPNGSTSDENLVLYKIFIREKHIPKLLTNPFLDVYSTTQYFEIEEDNFENIEIFTITER